MAGTVEATNKEATNKTMVAAAWAISQQALPAVSEAISWQTHCLMGATAEETLAGVTGEELILFAALCDYRCTTLHVGVMSGTMDNISSLAGTMDNISSLAFACKT